MERYIQLEYNALSCSTEVGHDTVKSITVTTNMLHYNPTQPQRHTTVTAHVFGLASWLLLIQMGLIAMSGAWLDVS